MRDVGLPSSKSKIWAWMKARYRQWRWEAWEEIPNRITASLWWVKRCARQIERCAKQTGKPVVLIEWGGGNGAFAFRLLKAVDPSVMPYYLFCDLQASMPEVLRQHPDLKAFCASERLGFWVQDLEDDAWMESLEARFPSDRYLLVMVANYVADALPSDVWKREGERLMPAALTLEINKSEWRDAELSDMRFGLEYGADLDVSEAWYQALLAQMRDEGLYHVPVAFLRMLERLRTHRTELAWMLADIPLTSGMRSQMRSPYFVDGMLAGRVDFMLLSLGAQILGYQVALGALWERAPLAVIYGQYGLSLDLPVEDVSSGAYWFLSQIMQAMSGPWDVHHMEGYVELMGYDPSILGHLIDHQTSKLVRSMDERAQWIRHFRAFEQQIFWTHGSQDLLHLATLYRWHEHYEAAMTALIRYAKTQGYDHAYWYCMGYVYFDQKRYADALEAWGQIDSPALQAGLTGDVQRARSAL